MGIGNMATLKEIGAELGVSHTLVSRVISGRMGTTRVGEATRKAILKRVKELDYQPNRQALALKSGRKGIIGVFLHHIGTRGSGLTECFIKEISRCLSDLNLRLWLRFFERDEEFLTACTRKLQREVDGLIVGGVPHLELMTSLKQIEHDGLPVICAFHAIPGNRGVINFEVDHEMQSYLATKHLLEIGCTRIAHFNCNQDRLHGYRRALREGGIRMNQGLIVDTKRYRYEDGLECIQKLCATGVVFDGLVAGSDAQAAAAIHWLVGNGMSISHLPKVVGIDNSPISENSLIPLTSVTAEMEATAAAAIEALRRKIEGLPVESKLLPPRLIVRRSTVL